MNELSPLEKAIENDALWLEDARGGRFSRYAIGDQSREEGRSAWFCNDCGAEIDDLDEGCDECGTGQPDLDEE